MDIRETLISKALIEASYTRVFTDLESSELRSIADLIKGNYLSIVENHVCSNNSDCKAGMC